MDNQENEQILTSEQQPAPQFIDIDNTAIPEYLEIVKSEYENERNKKQSFENRAGLVMALVGAICIFIFEKVQLKDVFMLMNVPLTFYDLTKIASGLAVYGALLFTLIMLLKTIMVKQHHNFEVKSLNENLVTEQRISALCRLTFTYRDIIVQHRELNEMRAKSYRRSLYGVSVILVAAIIYITIL